MRLVQIVQSVPESGDPQVQTRLNQSQRGQADLSRLTKWTLGAFSFLFKRDLPSNLWPLWLAYASARAQLCAPLAVASIFSLHRHEQLKMNEMMVTVMLHWLDAGKLQLYSSPGLKFPEHQTKFGPSNVLRKVREFLFFK